jgi:hypothetical protein
MLVLLGMAELAGRCNSVTASNRFFVDDVLGNLSLSDGRNKKKGTGGRVW